LPGYGRSDSVKDILFIACEYCGEVNSVNDLSVRIHNFGHCVMLFVKSVYRNSKILCLSAQLPCGYIFVPMQQPALFSISSFPAAVCAAFLGLSPRFPFADNSITDKYYAFVSKR